MRNSYYKPYSVAKEKIKQPQQIALLTNTQSFSVPFTSLERNPCFLTGFTTKIEKRLALWQVHRTRSNKPLTS